MEVLDLKLHVGLDENKGLVIVRLHRCVEENICSSTDSAALYDASAAIVASSLGDLCERYGG
jgi:hypothetical protein